MSFDILGKDIAVLFILAVIFGVATYFYALHKGKKEKRKKEQQAQRIKLFLVSKFLHFLLHFLSFFL